MTFPVKLFTLYAQLQGEQLVSGNLRLPVINAMYYKQGTVGYFVVQDVCPNFVIVNYIP